MARYLITGRSGTGKSEVCRELSRRGLHSYDGDKVEGLARWLDATNGQPVEPDYTLPIDPKETIWAWDLKVLQNLLDQNPDMFLCGSADNQLQFHTLFDKVFVLDVKPELQRERILRRKEHDFGKLPEMQEQILAGQKVFLEQALGLGAVAIDANLPVNAVVDTILKQIQKVD